MSCLVSAKKVYDAVECADTHHDAQKHCNRRASDSTNMSCRGSRKRRYEDVAHEETVQKRAKKETSPERRQLLKWSAALADKDAACSAWLAKQARRGDLPLFTALSGVETARESCGAMPETVLRVEYRARATVHADKAPVVLDFVVCFRGDRAPTYHVGGGPTDADAHKATALTLEEQTRIQDSRQFNWSSLCNDLDDEWLFAAAFIRHRATLQPLLVNPI